jgi:hypothetical protein
MAHDYQPTDNSVFKAINDKINVLKYFSRCQKY